MILTFPAFFAPAQTPSGGGPNPVPRHGFTKEAQEASASARTADEVRAGSVAAHGRPDGPTPRSSAARESGGPARTFYDIFFDSIKATVEAFDGR